MERLQFMRGKPQGDGSFKVVELWHPERSGRYDVDCATGRRYAAALVDVLRSGDRASLLPSIVGAMPRGAEFGGVEIGFLTGLAIEIGRHWVLAERR